MKITLIAALAQNRVIGINNTLPWKLSADLKRFKALTTGHTIVMGRKTFESLGRPLPGRRHICVSRDDSSEELTADKNYPEQVFWCGDLHAALKQLARSGETLATNGQVFIIGGADIYSQALPLADTLELTHIEQPFEGDAYFPHFENMFSLVEETCGEENSLKFRFARYASNRPEGIIVRRARASDAAFIAQSQIKMAMESEGLELAAERVMAGVSAVFLNPNRGEYFIAERSLPNNTMQSVGCLLVQKEWSDWRNADFHWLHSVYIEKHERRKGIFRWLYKVVQARAHSQGACGLRLYVETANSVAQKTYASLNMNSDHYLLFEASFNS